MGTSTHRLTLLLIATALCGCGFLDDIRQAPNEDPVRLAVADAVAPMREDVEAQRGPRDHERLVEQLKHRIQDRARPPGIKTILPTGSAWGSRGERSNVGAAFMVIPENPRENEPYCLGVTVDTQDGVVFTTSDKATMHNDCEGIEAPVTEP